MVVLQTIPVFFIRQWEKSNIIILKMDMKKMDLGAIVDHCMGETNFDAKDFMVTGSRKLSSVSEMREILENHAKILLGCVERRKYYNRKMPKCGGRSDGIRFERAVGYQEFYPTGDRSADQKIDRESLPVEKIDVRGYVRGIVL